MRPPVAEQRLPGNDEKHKKFKSVARFSLSAVFPRWFNAFFIRYLKEGSL
jgi:hypothetical protein